MLYKHARLPNGQLVAKELRHYFQRSTTPILPAPFESLAMNNRAAHMDHTLLIARLYAAGSPNDTILL